MPRDMIADERWQTFGNRLEAVGFDQLIAEVERLNAANGHPAVRYEAALVTCHGYDALYPREIRKKRIEWPHVDLFERSSAAAVKRRLETSYEQAVFNQGAPIVYTDRAITLQQAEAERAAAQETAEQAVERKATESVRELEEINAQLLERLKARRKKTTELRSSRSWSREAGDPAAHERRGCCGSTPNL